MRALREILILCATIGSVSLQSVATASDQRSVKVRGRAEVTVTNSIIQLGDIAEVSSANVEDDDIVIGLQKIFISDSPIPGQVMSISAGKVLERLRAEGINVEQIGYTFPRDMRITRASRQVSHEEMFSLVEQTLQKTDGNLVLKSISYRRPLHVDPQALDCGAVPAGVVTQGRLSIRVSCPPSGGSAVGTTVEAAVEQWREVPVASRPLPRGSLISIGDVAMARMDAERLPVDSVSSSALVVGLATTQDIGMGEVLRRSKIAVPPMITSGSRVTMRYRSGALEVTALGTALENGIEGQEIRVRNEASRRIVTGRVTEPGVVEMRGMR